MEVEDSRVMYGSSTQHTAVPASYCSTLYSSMQQCMQTHISQFAFGTGDFEMILTDGACCCCQVTFLETVLPKLRNS